MSDETEAHAVVVGASSSGIRRVIGPTSWMVLEELLMHSRGPADACVARVSIRSLAASMGLAKDTIARAIRVLRDAGIVTATQTRTIGGVFDAGWYVIAVPDGIALVESAHPASPRRPRVGRRGSSPLSLSIES